MTRANPALNAYGDIAAPSKTPRSVEYEAFAKVTHSLSRADKAHAAGEQGAFARLAEALCENQRLWTMLAGDVAGDGNGLPAPLRARLFYLAEFTREHSRSVLDGSGAVGVLVDINTAVMRGLSGRVGAGQAGAAA